ncbi:MAG: GNAT family N-acetyltransferase, partial [Bacteroidota bacterium]
MKKTITPIRTERLLLRPILASDLHNVYSGLSHPTVIKVYGVSFQSLAATEEQMIWYALPEQCWWAVCSANDHTFFGAGGLNDISEAHKKAEIG